MNNVPSRTPRLLPAYPFDPELDAAFADEIIDDFHDIGILEQTKACRWYHNNQPAARFKLVRATATIERVFRDHQLVASHSRRARPARSPPWSIA